FRGAALRAFEDHVLHEMGEAIFLRNFAARTVANPDADGDGTDVRHRLGDNDETVGEHVALDVANLRSHEGIVTHAEGKWRAASEKTCRRNGRGVYTPFFLYLQILNGLQADCLDLQIMQGLERNMVSSPDRRRAWL